MTIAPSLVAERVGDAVISATYGRHAISEPVHVAEGRATTEFAGGLSRVCDLCPSPHGLLIANQGAEVLVLRRDFRLETLIRLNVPKTAASGIDQIAVDDESNIFVRAIWDRGVYQAGAASGFCEIQRISIPDPEATPMAMAWVPGFGLVIGDHRHRLWQWTPEIGVPRFWTSVPVLPIRMAHAAGDLWVLGASGTPGLLRLSSSGEVRGDVLPRIIPVSPSDFLVLEASTLITDFNGGRVIEITDAGVVVLEQGLSAPNAIAVVNGNILVANFDGDSVVRLAARPAGAT